MHGYTQEAFAALFDISQNTLSNYETGKRSPDPDFLARVANRLKCPSDYLLDADQICDGRIGQALKSERETQGYSLKELSKETKIPLQDLKDYEEDIEPINFYLLFLICKTYGISVKEFYVKNDMYDEDIPRIFNGDIDAYTSYLKARDEDVQKDKSETTNHTDFLNKTEKDLIADFRELNLEGQGIVTSTAKGLVNNPKYKAAAKPAAYSSDLEEKENASA